MVGWGRGYRIDGAAETGVVDSGVLVVGVVFWVVYVNLFWRFRDATDMFFRSVYSQTFRIDLPSTSVPQK
jgi:hypothetical protein